MTPRAAPREALIATPELEVPWTAFSSTIPLEAGPEIPTPPERPVVPPKTRGPVEPLQLDNPLKPGLETVGRRDRRSGSTDQSGLRVSTLAGQVGGPVVHEPTPAPEQVCSPVGRLDLVLDYNVPGLLREEDGKT